MENAHCNHSTVIALDKINDRNILFSLPLNYKVLRVV